MHRYHVQKSCKKVFYVILLKFGYFTEILEISVILLPWEWYYVKTYYKQPNKHLLKINVNLTAKVSKTTLKYIECSYKKVSEYMRQIYRRTLIAKCDFIKATLPSDFYLQPAF